MKLSFNVTFTTVVAPGTALIVAGEIVAVPADVAIVEIVVLRAVAAAGLIVKMLASSSIDDVVHESANDAPSVPSPSTSVDTVAAGAHLRPATPVIRPSVSVTTIAPYDAVVEKVDGT